MQLRRARIFHQTMKRSSLRPKDNQLTLCRTRGCLQRPHGAFGRLAEKSATVTNPRRRGALPAVEGIEWEAVVAAIIAID
jgi:hypothetical protein